MDLDDMLVLLREAEIRVVLRPQAGDDGWWEAVQEPVDAPGSMIAQAATPTAAVVGLIGVAIRIAGRRAGVVP